MNKFSKIVEAQEGAKSFSYTANVQVVGVVYAENEGEAGYQVDSLLGAIPGADTWEIGEITPSTNGSVMESASNNGTLEDNARVYGAGQYVGLKDGRYDRWSLNTALGVKEARVERHLKLDADQVYIFELCDGDIAKPVGASRIKAV